VNDKAELTPGERKTLVEVLAFRALEKSVTKHYKIRQLGRIRRLIKKKWKKVLPMVRDDFLKLGRNPDPKELKYTLDLLLLYSNLYSDLVDPYVMGRCQACVKKLGTLNMMPALTKELETEIDKIVAIKPGPKKKAQTPIQPRPYKERPHLNPNVRRKLVDYFRKELKVKEPMLMVDPRLKLRIDNIIRRYIDRILDVSLEHGYMAMQYGYIAETTNGISDYVEEKGRESIDWMIKSGVLIEELAKELK
jgi:hypothetical protein